jgi:hypothetical protein
MTLLTSVERYLRRTSVAPSRFGRDVAGDPRFVFDLRRGREPRPATAARVLAFIAGHESVRIQPVSNAISHDSNGLAPATPRSAMACATSTELQGAA